MIRPHSSNVGTDTNTNTGTDTNTNTNTNSHTNSNTNTKHHNYHLSSETTNLNSFSSNGGSSSNNAAVNHVRNAGHIGPDPNIDGLAQNIMINVKNKLELQGTRVH